METLTSWIDIPESSDFSIYNLPFGIYSTKEEGPRAGVAIGDKILDLTYAANLDVFSELNIDPSIFTKSYLNDFIACGKSVTSRVRLTIQKELCDTNSILKNIDHVFVDMKDATMHIPVKVGDYTDFYSSMEHATNVGKLFRDPENALLSNWRHLPVAYHGRASSIVESGVDIHRPKGQILNEQDVPVFAPTQKLDFELEVAFITGKKTEMGSSISTDEAEDYIFGLVLFNDWSARDIQKWEYRPLGPFLGKNFASSISPWVVPLEALEPFRTEGPAQKPEPLEYLKSSGAKNFDIRLETAIQTGTGNSPVTVSETNFKYMYWNMSQQLAHHTINGCNINVGDMMASGTISGSAPGSYGSMLELSDGGKTPIDLGNGEKRTFLEDDDTVIMKGFSEKNGIRVGFGEVKSKILPANN